MRIAIFSDTYVPEVNGVARTLKRLADYLTEREIDYKLFVPETLESTAPKTPTIERFRSIPFMLYRECRLAFPNVVHLKQSVEAFNPDIIHVATPFNLGLFAHHFGKKHHIPMVASYHTHFDDYLSYYHLDFLEKWLWKYMKWFHRPFEKVYVPSESTKAKLAFQDFHSNIDIWGRGVDHDFFTPQKRSTLIKENYGITEKNIILYAGRIAPEKDIQTVIKTYFNLPKSLFSQTHLIMAGDGPLLSELKEKYNKEITFTGFANSDKLAELYASADIFMFPSATETFGNVVLEALSSGLPVIGADKGGTKHLVTDRKTGYLCSPGHVASFTTACTEVLTNTNLKAYMGRQARIQAMAHSWEDIFTKLMASYSTVVEQKRKATA
ncbi:glycosyltransferase family 1 protein [Salipaludibacillus agaradhaerens]|uniref:glycosyltransferase family 4 protein n=1 Tax=Salipaludibacillus agaradhaerens TaxID=76935 RepID=UPI002150F4CC|nr:glycosyltransferase family 1 protein [Salipaludibacillus agaradhaerens]MCR6106838.1 glycosyltransferase family 1 protein [Salipaludibacillus agaradhaerens]MCR6118870.1 glycosyltransferase family 1 protein [Salipaludibacillus agaradhaerens]